MLARMSFGRRAAPAWRRRSPRTASGAPSPGTKRPSPDHGHRLMRVRHRSGGLLAATDRGLSPAWRSRSRRALPDPPYGRKICLADPFAPLPDALAGQFDAIVHGPATPTTGPRSGTGVTWPRPPASRPRCSGGSRSADRARRRPRSMQARGRVDPAAPTNPPMAYALEARQGRSPRWSPSAARGRHVPALQRVRPGRAANAADPAGARSMREEPFRGGRDALRSRPRGEVVRVPVAAVALPVLTCRRRSYDLCGDLRPLPEKRANAGALGGPPPLTSGQT
jgi:hypothetical protein